MNDQAYPVNWAAWGDVVLKVSQDIHPSVIARLEKERDILDELNSRYFPRLLYYEVFTEDPETEAKLPFRLFVTVEQRILGGPLTAHLGDFGNEIAVLPLMQHLVRALTILWSNSRRIVHRDLKPDNIIIRPDHTPVIIDLGIVREEGAAGVTDTSWNIGPCTPGYASPEQLRNEKMNINFRSDVFSLGVLTYELLCPGNPFRKHPAEPIQVVAHRTLNDTVTSLCDLGKSSIGLSELISSMMAKDAYKRPRTWTDLATRLDELAGGALP